MEEQTLTTTPAATTPEPTPATEPTNGAQDGQSTPAPELKYTEAELTKRLEEAKQSVKGGYDGTIKKLKEDLALAQEQISKAAEAAQDAQWAKVFKAVEDSKGNVELVKELANRDKAIRAKEADIAKRASEIEEQLKILNEAGRQKRAHDLATELKLGKAAQDELLKEPTKEAMELKALRLALQARETQSTAPEKTPQSKQSGTGGDMTGKSESEKLGWALEQALRK